MDNHELIDLFLNSAILLGKKTSNNYRSLLHSFEKLSTKSFLELTPSDIRSYVIYKRDNRIWKSSSTITVNIVLLRAFFRFLINEHLLSAENNPMRGIKTPPQRLDGELRTLSAEEIRKVLRAADSSMIELRERLIFYIAMTTGLRASEIASIRKENIDLSKRLIYMPQDDVKGKNRARRVPLSEHTKGLIELYCTKYPNNTEYLLINRFGNRLGYQMIYRAMRNVIDVAYPYQNSWKKPCGPHIARHTFASRWIESGGDMHALKAIMGWSTFKQFDRYVTVSESFISKAARHVEKKLLKV